MSNQSIPPPPPMYGPTPPNTRAGAWDYPRWSALAIAAFVCSLLPCLGITALAGLVLGVFAIFATGPGKARGRGFAISALVISTLNGLLFVMMYTALFAVLQFAGANMARVKAILSTDAGLSEKADAWLTAVATPEFRESVSVADLTRWAAAVRAKHGSLIELTPAGNERLQRGYQDLAINLEGRFVNGTAPVRLVIRVEGLTSFKLADVSVDGVSPRSPAPPAKEATP